MKTIKIIDLLNKIANGEEVPKKIKYDNKIWEWDNWSKDWADYVYSGCDGLLNDEGTYDLFAILNDEVEIIEEDKEENEIPNINLDNMKDIGTKVGKAYRELFEGLNKGWNTPLEEDKEIEKITNDFHFTGCEEELANKINEIIDKVNKLEKEE